MRRAFRARRPDDLHAPEGNSCSFGRFGIDVEDVAQFTGFLRCSTAESKNAASHDFCRHPRAATRTMTLKRSAEHDIEPFDLVVVNLYPSPPPRKRPGASRGGGAIESNRHAAVSSSAPLAAKNQNDVANRDAARAIQESSSKLPNHRCPPTIFANNSPAEAFDQHRHFTDPSDRRLTCRRNDQQRVPANRLHVHAATKERSFVRRKPHQRAAL